MSKARDDTSAPNKTVKKGRYWVRNTTKTPNPVEAKPRKRQRFVEPYRLSDEQRSAMLVPLEHLGIGDKETRSLFSAAMEYDLASCHSADEPTDAVATDSKPESSADDFRLSLSPLHDAARDLAERLKALDETARARLQQTLKETDRFRRTYDDEYFGVLRYELLRLAAVTKPPEQPVPNAKPAISEAAQRFVVRAADAFEECFDLKATAQVGGPFLLTLKAIAAATGIQIPTDAGSIAGLLKTT